MHLCAVHRGLQPKEKQQKKKKESRLFQSTTYLCDLILQWDCTEVKNSEWEGNAVLICKFYLMSNSNQLKKLSIIRRPCERNCAIRFGEHFKIGQAKLDSISCALEHKLNWGPSI